MRSFDPVITLRRHDRSEQSTLVVELLGDNADPKAQDIYQTIRTQYGVPTLFALSSPDKAA